MRPSRGETFWNPRRHRAPSVPYPVGGICQHCDQPHEKLIYTHSMTAYHWDGKTGPNPNPDLWLCPECHEGYIEFWQSQWDEYHAGLM